MSFRRVVATVIVMLLSVGLAACGSDGDDLDEFPRGAQVPYTATSAA